MVAGAIKSTVIRDMETNPPDIQTLERWTTPKLLIPREDQTYSKPSTQHQSDRKNQEQTETQEPHLVKNQQQPLSKDYHLLGAREKMAPEKWQKTNMSEIKTRVPGTGGFYYNLPQV